jgi:hypothetical protein
MKPTVAQRAFGPAWPKPTADCHVWSTYNELSNLAPRNRYAIFIHQTHIRAVADAADRPRLHAVRQRPKCLGPAQDVAQWNPKDFQEQLSQRKRTNFAADETCSQWCCVAWTFSLSFDKAANINGIPTIRLPRDCTIASSTASASKRSSKTIGAPCRNDISKLKRRLV